MVVRSVLLGLFLLSAGATALTDASVTATNRCGHPGQPPCPLQAWMRHEIAAPLAAGENEKLARNLTRLVTLNPDARSWTNWNRFAREAATAVHDAKRGRA